MIDNIYIQEIILKVEFIGNIYLQSSLNQQELSYLNSFASGVHFDNSSSPFLGLYDTSISKGNLLDNNFIFDKGIDLERSKNLNPVALDLSVLFPFFKSPIHFTEKSIKFDIIDLKSKEEFIFKIVYLFFNIPIK